MIQLLPDIPSAFAAFRRVTDLISHCNPPAALAIFRTLRLGALLAALVLFAAATPAVAQQAVSEAPVSAAAPSPDAGHAADHADAHAAPHVPSLAAALPFVVMLLMIALMPLIPAVHGWWEHNRNRLIVAVALGSVTCAYYFLRGEGFHHSEPGLPAVLSVLNHSILLDYVPFIVLLFSLFTISGGIYIGGDIPAHPRTNTALLFVGAMLASFIGTTGASMLLIRPLLQINLERRHVKHSVIFFIFLVSNVGGCLLPIGDPPLFLGYLRGVPFLWTLSLVKEWAFCVAVLLALYWAVDHWYYGKEEKKDLVKDEAIRRPLHVRGGVNLLLLVGVILCVALVVPGRTLPGTSWVIPNIYLREILLLALSGISMLLTDATIRKANAFSFYAIAEVAALFIGIFITMQPPIEILNLKGPDLGLHSPMQFFWATGALSSFLDNAPTYVVFFQTAGTLDNTGVDIVTGVATASGSIATHLLEAISLGAVFMGACTYIGNGPNFMVKSIAENYNIPMPSFFGYMAWSGGILLPVFAVMTWIFLS